MQIAGGTGVFSSSGAVFFPLLLFLLNVQERVFVCEHE